jgi:ApbE superfamily uncharacterized protein (UPF0280 family)
MNGPTATLMDQGRRLHLQHGPIDLIIGVDGRARDAAFAATLIANAVDLGEHAMIERVAACELQPDSDLGDRRVVTRVGGLEDAEIVQALDAGAVVARDMMSRNLIEGAALYLRGEQRIIGANLRPLQQQKVIHARANFAKTLDCC